MIDRIFRPPGAGTHPGAMDQLRALVTPGDRAPAPVPTERGSVLASFTGFGRDGHGRERVLDAFERLGMIRPDQRARPEPVGPQPIEPSARSIVAAHQPAAIPGTHGAGGSLYEQFIARTYGYGSSGSPAPASARSPEAASGRPPADVHASPAPPLLSVDPSVAASPPAQVSSPVPTAPVEPLPTPAVPRVPARVPAAPNAVVDDALRGVMGFAAGVDDTARLLAQVLR